MNEERSDKINAIRSFLTLSTLVALFSTDAEVIAYNPEMAVAIWIATALSWGTK